MEGNQTSGHKDTPQPMRDPPLWARAVAAVLVIFASWWLLDSDSIRSFIGESVGALCLGVIAVSILQGLHIPLGLWPEGPWRKQFNVVAVVVTALFLALLILLSEIAAADEVLGLIDLGTGIAVVGGGVGLGFAVGFVRQKRYLAWYGIALMLGFLPFVVEFALTLVGTQSTSGQLCFFSAADAETGCEVAIVPSLALLLSVGVTAKLVTEEIAFRRMLIGIAEGAGLLSVLLSGLISFVWYLILSRSGVGTMGLSILGALGAVSAGSLYVLSRSIVVSALFSATYAAGTVMLATANPVGESADGTAISVASLTVVSIVSLALAAVVMRKHGFLGNLKQIASTDVTSN